MLASRLPLADARGSEALILSRDGDGAGLAKQRFHGLQHSTRNDLRALGRRMNPIALEILQIRSDDIGQQKRDQRELIFRGEILVDLLERTNIVRAEIRWQ